MKENQKESRWIDQVLVAVMACLSLFSIGQATSEFLVSYILMGIACFGCAVSFLVTHSVGTRKLVRFDGWLLATLIFIDLFFERQLSGLLPGQAFPAELLASGFLSWAIALGCFVVWRDETRMFITVPAIALFGLIGVYDTYRNVVFPFFVFLLCLAWLFGRAHARSMLKRALMSGFSRIEEGLSLDADRIEQDTVLRAMRRGPWRWMAGPEWAFGLALVVVVFSVIGAPVVQFSVQRITGQVAEPLSRLKSTVSQNSNNPEGGQTFSHIGNGPVHLTDKVVGYLDLEHPIPSQDSLDYLRSTTYDEYLHNTWSRSSILQSYAYNEGENGLFRQEGRPDLQTEQPPMTIALQNYNLQKSWITNPIQAHFHVELLSASGGPIPVPGQIGHLVKPTIPLIQSDGTLSTNGRRENAFSADGTVLVPSFSPQDKKFPDSLHAIPDDDGLATTDRVRDLAIAIAKGYKTDYEKADAIMRAIGSRCNYNQKASAVPDGRDAVDYFLFDSHEGYCDLFASAMVTMARSVGIKSRYVVGYLVDQNDKDSQGNELIRANESHAFAELAFKHSGWVVFDPTGLAKDVTPQDSGIPNKLEVIGAAFIALFLLGGTSYLVYLQFKKPRNKGKQFLKRSLALVKLDKTFQRFSRHIEALTGERKPEFLTIQEWLTVSEPFIPSHGHKIFLEIGTRFSSYFYGPNEPSDSELKDLEIVVLGFIKNCPKPKQNLIQNLKGYFKI